MLLITTPTGNSGRAVVADVHAANQPMRLYLRDAGKLPPALRSGAEIVEGDLLDAAKLQKAATGAVAAFFCVPQSGESPDVGAYYQAFAEAAAGAFGAAGVKRMVTISGGRGNPADVGPSGPLARMEQLLDATGAATRHLRCGYFMENFLYCLPQIQYTGGFALPIPGDYKLACMAAEDIGKTAARWLLDHSWQGQEGVTVPYGESLSMDEAAAILSQTLGRPVQFTSITGQAYTEMLMKFGVSKSMGKCLAEMFETIDEGSIGEQDGTNRRGGIQFQDFALRTLKPAFSQQGK